MNLSVCDKDPLGINQAANSTVFIAAIALKKSARAIAAPRISSVKLPESRLAARYIIAAPHDVLSNKNKNPFCFAGN